MAVCPFADQSHRFDGDWPGSYVSGPWRGVLHTTETEGLPGYGNGSMAPHLTVDPKARKTYQHFNTSRPARALQHPRGTVDTNNLHCVQIEIVAYSDERVAAEVHGTAVSELDDGDYAYIAKVMRWVESEHPINPTSGLTFKPYPSSYGADNGVRMSTRAWREFNGWCGHQHVPNNHHGDPSNLNIEALLEGDMALTDDDKKWILETLVPRQALENWRYDQGGKKSQAWAYLQRGATTTQSSVITDEQVEKALRNILADLAGKGGSGN